MGVITARILGEMVGKNLVMGEMVETEIGGKNRKVLPIFYPSPVNPWGREKNKKIFEKYKSALNEIVVQ